MHAAASGTAWQTPFVATNGHIEEDHDPWALPSASGHPAASAKVVTPVVSSAADSGTSIVGEVSSSSGPQAARAEDVAPESARISWGFRADYNFEELLKSTGETMRQDGGCSRHQQE